MADKQTKNEFEMKIMELNEDFKFVCFLFHFKFPIAGLKCYYIRMNNLTEESKVPFNLLLFAQMLKTWSKVNRANGLVQITVYSMYSYLVWELET